MQLPPYLATWGEAGTFLAGLASILGIGFAMLKWILSHHQKQTVRAVRSLGEQFFTLLRHQMENAAIKAGHKRCRVIDLTFIDGPALRVPLILDEWLPVLPGVEIMGDQFREDRTTYFLRVDNTSRIRTHTHRGTESVHVIKGRMVDLLTGRSYGAGETWEIPAGEPHSVHFEAPYDGDGHGIVLITVIPPLNSTAEESLALEGLSELARM